MKIRSSSLGKALNDTFRINGESIEETKDIISPIVDTLPFPNDIIDLSGGTTNILTERYLLFGLHFNLLLANAVSVSSVVFFTPVGNTEKNFSVTAPNTNDVTKEEQVHYFMPFPRPILLEKDTRLQLVNSGSLTVCQVTAIGSFLR